MPAPRLYHSMKHSKDLLKATALTKLCDEVKSLEEQALQSIEQDMALGQKKHKEGCYDNSLVCMARDLSEKEMRAILEILPEALGNLHNQLVACKAPLGIQKLSDCISQAWCDAYQLHNSSHEIGELEKGYIDNLSYHFHNDICKLWDICAFEQLHSSQGRGR